MIVRTSLSMTIGIILEGCIRDGQLDAGDILVVSFSDVCFSMCFAWFLALDFCAVLCYRNLSYAPVPMLHIFRTHEDSCK